jgi:low temperature requirement protein LtrA
MLGEVVISVGVSAADVPVRSPGFWLGITSGLLLAGALWWIYFDTAAQINEIMLRLSGGNPAVAYGLYAVGYLLPTFALLLIAAGCGLALQESPPPATVWLVTVGLAAYLVGIRGFEVGRRGRRRHLLQVLTLAVTLSIPLLSELLIGPLVVAVAAVWAMVVAAVMTRRGPWLPQHLLSG